MRSHSHQKRKFFFFCGKWKTYFSNWEDLGRKSCAVLEEGQGTFLSFFFTLFIPLVFYFFTFFLLLIFFLWISFRNEVQFTPKRTNFHFFFENGRHMSLIEQIWGSRQEILCSFRGLAEMSDISPCNWKYQNTLSKPYENKSKELLIEIVMVALEGWNLGNL